MKTSKCHVSFVFMLIAVMEPFSAHGVVIDVSGVKLNALAPQPIPAGKRVTSFSYEYDYNKESNTSISASFALSLTLSSDAILGSADDISLGTLNTSTGTVSGISGHVSSTTSNPNGLASFLVPPSTVPGVFNVFLQMAPRGPHTDPDSNDAIGQLLGSVTVIANPNPLGDYNYNGVVEASDYVMWRNFIGQTGVGMSADGDGSNSIDSGDYDVWRANFGNTVGGGAALPSAELPAGALPEPSSVLLATVALLSFCRRVTKACLK